MNPINTPDLSDSFIAQLRALAGELNADALDVAGVMFSEGGCSATAWNRTSDASGLIQFMPSTLRSLGYMGYPADFRKLTADQQMPFVRSYFMPYANNKFDNIGRLYQVVFLPASLAWALNPGDVVCHHETTPGAPAGLQDILRQAYAGNASVDIGNKGYISVQDLITATSQRCAGPRWDELAARIVEAAGEPPQPHNNADALDQLRVMHALVSTGDFYRRRYDLRDLHANDKAALKRLAEAANAPV